MKKTMILIMVAVATTSATAQSVTYNHDSSKQNQITVMETGGGSLTPEFYYWLLHNSYKKTAAEKNKLGFRTLAGINLYNQVDDAEKIDSALTKRAEVEALNVADRQTDLAWLAESSKIDGQLDKMKANIDQIVPTGGNVNDKRRWEELYNMYQCAVKATKDAYMPNAQRKRQYLSNLCRPDGTERDTAQISRAAQHPKPDHRPLGSHQRPCSAERQHHQRCQEPLER